MASNLPAITSSPWRQSASVQAGVLVAQPLILLQWWMWSVPSAFPDHDGRGIHEVTVPFTF